jgi:GT2 family glycosyltransferase
MRTAVVTIAHGRHRHLVAQQRSLACGSTRPDVYVVVAMDDPDIAAGRAGLAGDLHPDVVDVSADGGGLPLAAARNAGAVRALALGADVVIMLDVDCLAGRDLVGGYTDAVSTRPTTVWSGPVTYLPPPEPEGYRLDDLDAYDDPHPARPAPRPGELVHGGDPDLFWSLSFGLHRDAWELIGGFCEEYVGYGGEDTDFGHLALEHGVRLGWAGTPRAYHQHHATADPPYQHLDDILRNGRIFHDRWDRWPMEGWLRAVEREGLVTRHGDDWVRADTAKGLPPALPQVRGLSRRSG